MTEYLKKTFTVRLGSKSYSDNWSKIFGRKHEDPDAGPPDRDTPDSGGDAQAGGEEQRGLDSGVSDLQDPDGEGGVPATERQGPLQDLQPVVEAGEAEGLEKEAFWAKRDAKSSRRRLIDYIGSLSDRQIQWVWDVIHSEIE